MYKYSLLVRNQEDEIAEYQNQSSNLDKSTYSHFFANQKFFGVPFNIASYALLTLMIAQVCGLKPGEFIHTFGDVHIYQNHLGQVKIQLEREPRALPTMKINPNVKDIFSFQFEDFQLAGYDPHPHIKGAVSV